MSSLVASLCSILQDRSLPLFEYNEIIASISGRIPAELDVKLREILQQGLDTTSGIDMNRIENEMQKVLENSSPDSRATFSASMEPLFAWIDKFKPGMEAVYSSTLISILKSYMDIESYFDNKSEADAMTTLRQQFKTESPKIFEMALASTKRETRSSLILAVLEVIDREQTESSKKVFGPIIRDLANLNSARASKVSLRAREMVISNQQPSFLERKESMLNILKDAVKESKNLVHNLDPRSFAKLVTGNHAILDILSDLFYHPKKEINACALFTYVLHTYQAYSTRNLKTHLSEQHVALSWEFNVRNANAASKVVNSNTATGLICAFESLENISTELEALALPIYCEESAKTKAIPAHILNIAVRSSSRLENDSEAQQIFQELAKSMNALFTKCHLKRVTFMVIQENQFPRYFTFKESKRYEEDLVIRHTEPAMAHRLELSRMSNYDIKPCFIDNRRVHIYHGTAKSNPQDTRFFVRAIIHPGQAKESVTPAEFLVSEGSKIIADVLDAVELLSAGQYRNTDCNHVLLSFIQTFSLDLEKLEMGVRDIIRRHRNRLFKLRITEAEIRFSRLNPNTKVAKTTRFVISSNSGFVIQLGVYQEVRDANGVQTLMTVSSPPGPLHNMPVESPYPIKEKVQPKRQKAHALGTTYIYDFPELFKGALKRLWTNYVDGEGMKPPTVLVNYRELVLNSMGELEESNNPPGSNTCGMVAWEMELLTPEYPEGRHIIVIGNDITFNIGSFGPIEDLLFLKASQLARQRGIPRVYISANSGARIGLADEVSDKFKIEWIDPQNPSRGFKYLYLDEADYQKLNHDKPVVIGHKVEDDGRIKYRLDSIIGKEHGLGVENLQGSGQIAGETSRAYDEIFTITLVTCRSVGIGAYLVRLGQRTVQVEGAPIILTGANALNKVYGREVYTSNLQLGGTQIMHGNGVSHLVASNDLEGVVEIVKWLSFVPKEKNSSLPVLPSTDPVDRDIEVDIPKTAYDPRTLLQGCRSENGFWHGGFFDKDSFQETMSGWANSVIVGRARIGGIPVGVIVTESRTTENVEFADPSVETSHEQINVQAGQVWYPNSAFKTAQAIRDFNKGEQLPLMIFANWRGFSGGQSDMHKEVLKFGAHIVDALVDFKQPIFVYIIGELRGGAWVVLDPTINPQMMEIYSEEEGRGGVIEPPGIVEIKFREKKIVATIERLDPVYRDLKEQLKANPKSDDLARRLEKRESELFPIFQQAAISFADLHDRPGRMLAKGVLKQVIQWRSARSFFYWRLLRRICESRVLHKIRSSDETIDFTAARSIMKSWFFNDVSSSAEKGSEGEKETIFDESDMDVVRWINNQKMDIEERISDLRAQRLTNLVKSIYMQSPSSVIDTFIAALGDMDEAAREKVKKAMQ